MRVVIAPDKFRGSLTGIQAANAMAAGVRRAHPDAAIDCCPLADGGEGTVSALVSATSGSFHVCRVTGPLPEQKVDATFGMLDDGRTAVVEMAAASGLALLGAEERNPLFTTTFGTGELLVEAARLGAQRIILGIGGSATIDAGIGCAQACGLPVLLEGGEPVSATEPLTGADLPRVVLIKHGRGSPIDRVAITVACDVTNPLFGPNGAAAVYGPQKGASPQQVAQLDEWLRQLTQRTGKLAEAMTPGAGAAGGLGFAMLAFFGATLRSGAELGIEMTGLRRRLRGANLCLTGEGRLDASSANGKAPIAVARLCREMGVPCTVIAGSAAAKLELESIEGLSSYVLLNDGSTPIETTIRDAAKLVADAAEKVALCLGAP